VSDSSSDSGSRRNQTDPGAGDGGGASRPPDDVEFQVLRRRVPGVTPGNDTVIIAASISTVIGAVLFALGLILDWLVEFGSQDFETDEERKVVFRQYILHRLLVLSIFHPARMGDFFSNTTPQEIHELLISARAAVRLHVSDTSIWSNWDLIMITWAAVIVLQGVAAGYGEPYGKPHHVECV
jgi:hypothetical protein